MDFTLIQYDFKRTKSAMYEYLKRNMLALGSPVEDLGYVPDMIVRGLIVDKKRGNIVKANRFGYVKQAHRGTKPIDFRSVRNIYSRLTIDIREDRWLPCMEH